MDAQQKLDKAAEVFGRLNDTERKWLADAPVADNTKGELYELFMKRAAKTGHTGPLAQEAMQKAAQVLGAIAEEEEDSHREEGPGQNCGTVQGAETDPKGYRKVLDWIGF